MAEEKVFFQQEGVVVTNSRFAHGGQTYAMANVTSVKAARASWGWAVMLIIIGVLMLIGAEGGGKGFGVFLAILGGLLFWFRRAFVILHTAGAEQRALASRNPSFVTNIVAAVNEAIIHRG